MLIKNSLMHIGLKFTKYIAFNLVLNETSLAAIRNYRTKFPFSTTI